MNNFPKPLLISLSVYTGEAHFNLIPAKSPDAGGCALTTLAVKSSTNRGPGEGLKSGSGEIVGPGSGTLLINPGMYVYIYIYIYIYTYTPY